MVKDQTENDTRIESFKDLMLNTTAGRMMTIGAVGMTLYMGFIGSIGLLHNYTSNQDTILQENLIGNTSPDTYIEKNGVKYFSHIDGQYLADVKDISDLVK